MTHQYRRCFVGELLEESAIFGLGATLAVLSPELRIHPTAHRMLRRDEDASG